MAESLAEEYFSHAPEWRLMACRQCKYAVWPEQAAAQLKGAQYTVKHGKATAIQHEVENRAELLQYPPEFVPIEHTAQTVEGLRLRGGDSRCREAGAGTEMEEETCGHICTTPGGMRKHWS